MPSQRTGKKYKVKADPQTPHCTCPDFAKRKEKCKHIFAVEYAVKRAHKEALPDLTDIKHKQTYRQNWPAYNKNQTREGELFPLLLYELCSFLDEPEQTRGRGQQPHKTKNMVFSMVYKGYLGTTSRKVIPNLQYAFDKGYLTCVPSYNSLSDYYRNKRLVPTLTELFNKTTRPFVPLEKIIAVDSTGFTTEELIYWRKVKYGRSENWHDWKKAHLAIGTKTNAVLAAIITKRYAHDSPYLRPLLQKVLENGFEIAEVVADKAYSSIKNLKFIEDIGAKAFIAFKENARVGGKSVVWDEQLTYRLEHGEEFLSHYHQRSNAEATMSMIKRVLGERIRSKDEIAQINELLAKIIAHNIRCVIRRVGNKADDGLICRSGEGADRQIIDLTDEYVF